MKSRFVSFAALGLACILAAGGGAYLAVRQSYPANRTAQTVNQPPAAVPPSTAQSTPAALATTPPPASSDTAPVTSPLPAAPAPESNATAASETRESAKVARRSRPEGRTRRADGDADRTAANQPDGTTVAGANSDATAQQAPPPEPQSITQVPPEPQREWIEVTVPAETVLGLQIQTAVSSETARIEDRVDARVTRDVRVGDRVAIPTGSQAIGSVVQVDRGGKVKDRAHFAIRFNTLILPDGTRLSLTADAVHREGPSPANKSAARIGGATIGGAILGAIIGGGKGAAIGGAIGAGGGTAATMASDREPATLPAGSVVNIRLMSPVTVTLER